MPGMTSAAREATAGELDEEVFAADAGAHASAAPPRSTAVAAVATPEGTRRKVEIVMWVK